MWGPVIGFGAGYGARRWLVGFDPSVYWELTRAVPPLAAVASRWQAAHTGLLDRDSAPAGTPQ